MTTTPRIVDISPAGIGWDIEGEAWVMKCGPDKLVPIHYVESDGSVVLPQFSDLGLESSD